MDENIAASLQEIAALLRRRVEQQDEQARRSEELHRHSEERFAKMDVFKSETPDFSRIQEDGEKQISEIRRASEERLIENNKKAERRQEEEREFRAHLLAELERNNTSLERICAALEKN